VNNSNCLHDKKLFFSVGSFFLFFPLFKNAFCTGQRENVFAPFGFVYVDATVFFLSLRSVFAAKPCFIFSRKASSPGRALSSA
jgi:hypothetical protein